MPAGTPIEQLAVPFVESRLAGARLELNAEQRRSQISSGHRLISEVRRHPFERLRH